MQKGFITIITEITVSMYKTCAICGRRVYPGTATYYGGRLVRSRHNRSPLAWQVLCSDRISHGRLGLDDVEQGRPDPTVKGNRNGSNKSCEELKFDRSNLKKAELFFTLLWFLNEDAEDSCSNIAKG